MKETDYSVIQQEIWDQLLDQEWTIESYLEEDIVVLAICNIYTTNDITSAFGQDFKYDIDELNPAIFKKLSIISTPEKISVITNSKMSYYKSDLPICGYQSLQEDIYNIFVIIQAVFDRIDSL